MENIQNYLVEEFGMAPVVANITVNKIKKHEDIFAEFVSTIEAGIYPPDGIKINGYSALDIHKLADFMNTAGVYNFLVTLKEKPQSAKEIIDSGFPRK